MIKNLLLLRIDERMNHGQVMISYMKKYPAKYPETASAKRHPYKSVPAAHIPRLYAFSSLD